MECAAISGKGRVFMEDNVKIKQTATTQTLVALLMKGGPV